MTVLLAPPSTVAPQLRDGANGGPADAIAGLLRESDRLIAAAVALVQQVLGSGVVERDEGLPLERALSLLAGWTGCDMRKLVAVAEALRQLPVTAAPFFGGELSWGH